MATRAIAIQAGVIGAQDHGPSIIDRMRQSTDRKVMQFFDMLGDLWRCLDTGMALHRELGDEQCRYLTSPERAELQTILLVRLAGG